MVADVILEQAVIDIDCGCVWQSIPDIRTAWIRKNVKQRVTAKERNTHVMLRYLSDPDNQFISRGQMITQNLGYKNPSAIYNHFTPGELREIEREALDIHRRKYASHIAEVDMALLKAATESYTS
jgi:hypothetical protein